MIMIRELTFDMLFRDRATKALKRANKQMDRASDSTKRLRRRSERLRRQQERLKKTNQGLAGTWKTLAGIAGVGFIIDRFRTLGTEAVSMAVAFEKTEISFATLLGSAVKGKKILQDLEDFSLATPFTPDPIIKSGRALLAAERPAALILEDLKKIGDVAAIAEVPLEDLTRIFAKVFSKGRATLEELFPVAERGIPILSTLARTMGVDTTAEILEMASKGEITFDRFNEAFTVMTSKGGVFEDGMKRLSLTAGGLISTFEGFRDIVKRTIGAEGLEPLKDVVRLMTDLAKQTLEWLKVAENAEFIKDLFRDLADTLAGLLKLSAFIVRNFAKFQQFKTVFDKTTLGRLLKPVGLAITPGEVLGQLGRIGRGLGGPAQPVAPRTEGVTALPGGPGERKASVEIGSLTVHANGAEEGRAAAEEIEKKLDGYADKLLVQLQ